MVRFERGNYYRKVILNMQKSAEVVVAKWNNVPFEVKDRINRSPKYDREKEEWLMKAENSENRDCPQRDSAEHEGYAEVRRSFRSIWKEKDSAQPELLERILYKDNLNRAYKRVKANKGAPGIDGITADEIGAYLRENQEAVIEKIYKGKYTPDPVRRKEIPKADGGMRKLGIPTVKDRIFQQAIAQQLMPIYEALFSEGSFGYRPGRSAKDAITKVKEYAEEGYRYAVSIDLSKYFDTLNHELLLNILRRNVKDERVSVNGIIKVPTFGGENSPLCYA